MHFTKLALKRLATTMASALMLGILASACITSSEERGEDVDQDVGEISYNQCFSENLGDFGCSPSELPTIDEENCNCLFDITGLELDGPPLYFGRFAAINKACEKNGNQCQVLDLPPAPKKEVCGKPPGGMPLQSCALKQLPWSPWVNYLFVGCANKKVGKFSRVKTEWVSDCSSAQSVPKESVTAKECCFYLEHFGSFPKVAPIAQ